MCKVSFPSPLSSIEISKTRFPLWNGFLKFQEAIALAIVAALPLIFYWRATLGRGMFFFGDIARFFYPTRVLYGDALRAGRLPLWQPEILTGIPLLAEMQTGALYPVHLLFYRLLPIDLALNYDILLHLAWLAAGMFLFARARGISIVGAMMAAMALTMGGFGAARVTHPNVLSVAAWLPWLLWLYEMWRVGWHRLLMWVLLTLAFALQWLGGHPQFALINILTFGGYVVGSALWAERPPTADGRRTTQNRPGMTIRNLSPAPLTVIIPLIAIGLGSVMAAAQLLPTFEFAQQSARAGGVDQEFFTTFSYNPLYLALLVAPFLRGNPYPNTSVEVIAYVGILPLVLAVAAVILKRNRAMWLWVVIGSCALVLAFGGNTPLYPALRVLPFFNLFRVPARFLFPFAFSLAMLAGIGFDTLLAWTKVTKNSRAAVIVGVIAIGLAIAVLVLVNVIPVETWLDVWRALPVVLGGLALLLVLRARRLDRVFFEMGALGLVLVDLFAFSSVYALTYNAIATREQIFPRPRVLDALDLSNGARVLTSEWIIPWISVMNESLYPNVNAAHGVTAAHGYTPLTPRRTSE